MPSAAAVLNPEPVRRTEGADRLAAELVDAALALPDPAARAGLTRFAGMLHSLDPLALAGDDTRRAFWINVHNALVRATLDAVRPRGTILRHRRLFDRAAWAIGGRRYSVHLIAHGLLRGNARVPLSFARAARASDPRLEAAPRTVDPRVLFALHDGTRAAVPIRVYLSGSLSKQLDLAIVKCFEQDARLDRERCVLFLPRVLRAFAADFGGTTSARLAFARRYLAADDGAWLERDEHERALRLRFPSRAWRLADLRGEAT